MSFKFYLHLNCLEVKKDKDGIKDLIRIPLRKVFREDLAELRDRNVPGFVLKQGNIYYYANISAFQNCRVIIEDTPSHQCPNCNRLSAAADEDGGCAKVRAFSRCIENFDWISLGYETFGTDSDVFIVLKCQHWQKSVYRPTHSVSQKQKVMLAQYLWGNIDSYHDLRVMMKKAMKRP